MLPCQLQNIPVITFQSFLSNQAGHSILPVIYLPSISTWQNVGSFRLCSKFHHFFNVTTCTPTAVHLITSQNSSPSFRPSMNIMPNMINEIIYSVTYLVFQFTTYAGFPSHIIHHSYRTVSKCPCTRHLSKCMNPPKSYHVSHSKLYALIKSFIFPYRTYSTCYNIKNSQFYRIILKTINAFQSPRNLCTLHDEHTTCPLKTSSTTWGAYILQSY